MWMCYLNNFNVEKYHSIVEMEPVVRINYLIQGINELPSYSLAAVLSSRTDCGADRGQDKSSWLIKHTDKIKSEMFSPCCSLQAAFASWSFPPSTPQIWYVRLSRCSCRQRYLWWATGSKRGPPAIGLRHMLPVTARRVLKDDSKQGRGSCDGCCLAAGPQLGFPGRPYKLAGLDKCTGVGGKKSTIFYLDVSPLVPHFLETTIRTLTALQ